MELHESRVGGVSRVKPMTVSYKLQMTNAITCTRACRGLLLNKINAMKADYHNTHPQTNKDDDTQHNNSESRCSVNGLVPSAFVSISDCCCLVPTQLIRTLPLLTTSRMK